MNGFDTARNLIDWFVALGVPSAIGWYVRDKRKNKQLRDATLDAENKRTLEFVQDAFAEERKSLKRQIDSCGEEIAKLKAELAERDKRIAALESRLMELENRTR